MKKYKLSSADNDYNIIAPCLKQAIKQYYSLSNQNPLGILHYKNNRYLLNLSEKVSNSKYRLKIKSVNIKTFEKDCSYDLHKLFKKPSENNIPTQAKACLSQCTNKVNHSHEMIGGVINNNGLTEYTYSMDFYSSCTVDYAEKIKGFLMYLLSTTFGTNELEAFVVDIRRGIKMENSHEVFTIISIVLPKIHYLVYSNDLFFDTVIWLIESYFDSYFFGPKYNENKIILNKMNLGIVINKINTLMNNKLQLKVIVNTTSSDNEIIERYTTLYNQMMYGSSNKLNFDEYAMNTNMQQVYDNLSNTSHNDKVLIKYDSYSQIFSYIRR
jgi:hypothetical protein